MDGPALDIYVFRVELQSSRIGGAPFSCDLREMAVRGLQSPENDEVIVNTVPRDVGLVEFQVPMNRNAAGTGIHEQVAPGQVEGSVHRYVPVDDDGLVGKIEILSHLDHPVPVILKDTVPAIGRRILHR